MRAGRPAVWAALLTIYVVWGSTFLAISFGLRTLPPFVLASSRFLTGGILMVLAGLWLARRAGESWPGRAAWKASFVLGLLLVLIGNGSVPLAQQRLSTGVASLGVSTVPLWMALFDRVIYGRRLSGLGACGIALGIAGAAVLAGSGATEGADPLGILILVTGSVAWALGSLWARTAPIPRQPLLATGMQMLWGGAALGVVALATGQATSVGHVSAESLGGLLYLLVVGSILAFTLYSWLLRNAPTPLVSTYAFANPVVAILLGWAVLDEGLGLRTGVAAALIVGAVALIVVAQARTAPAATLDR